MEIAKRMNAMCREALIGRERVRPIAVLDDDVSFREALVGALTSLGYVVLAFHAPQALLEAVGEIEPACIVSDFDLPGMSGLDMSRTLCKRGLSIPTIFVTAHSDSQVEARVRAAGAAGFLSKPIHLDSLDTLIAQSVEPAQERLP